MDAVRIVGGRRSRYDQTYTLPLIQESVEVESAGMEELEREIKRENKVLLKKVRALAAVVDYALAGLDA